MNFETDEILIESFKRGAPQADRHIFDLLYTHLVFFATRIINSSDDAEDVVQDSFLKLFERRPQFDSVPAIKSFLFTTTKRACLNILKRKKVGFRYILEMLHISGAKDPISREEVLRADFWHALLEELENLPQERRRIWKMFYLEKMPPEEIARKLNIALKTVYNQKANANKDLRIVLFKRGLMDDENYLND